MYFILNELVLIGLMFLILACFGANFQGEIYIFKFLLLFLNLSGEGNCNPTSILTWEIPWTEDPGELQSMGAQRVRHD